MPSRGTLCGGVIGHERARGYFRRAIAAERLSHAYLLVGPEGVGKRRFADELAAALLCLGQPSAARRAEEGGCGGCRSCALLGSENHPGLWVIAAEEGRSIEIDTVRDASEALALRGRGRRLLIFDDADRLTLPASNALLKILEEPPPGVMFCS